MSLWQRISRSDFLIKLKSWEYWPFGVVHFPAFIYWLWLSLRARSLVFFSASNPGIPMGGMFGESKFDILKKIPAQYVPSTLLIQTPVSDIEVMRELSAAGLSFPLIFKPDIGERGFMVQKISDRNQIAPYLKEVKCAFLAQEHVDLPLEFGVFYLKYPTESSGRVISVVAKEMLSVTGDGRSTLEELIYGNDRAKLQWKKLKVKYHSELKSVPQTGKRIELVSIGNHAQGARFINANHLISTQLSETFDSISRSISGFYFGRYDLRCSSIEDLYSGKVKIMELNGCGAEPGHIYDQGYPLSQAICELFRYWHHIFKIARANNRLGVDYISHREAYASYRRFKAVLR